jgi:transposase
MAGLCREFCVSRRTAYKILTRYNEIGLGGRSHTEIAAAQVGMTG